MECQLHKNWYSDHVTTSLPTATRKRAKGELTRKGEQTRLRIVEAAAELILSQGVAGTTLDDVRAAAGVSSSQIYHYFAGKQELVRAVVELQSDLVIGHHEPLLAEVDGLDGLRVWRDFIVEHQRQVSCRGGCPLGSLGSELADSYDDARRDVASGFARWEGAIRVALRRMHERGELTAGADPEGLATATLAALQGGLLLTQIEKSTRPLEAALDTMISLIAANAPGKAR
jgi:TetR/AcrR family transcriptional regulator, transcriptional repressor for nem operon